MNSICDVHNRNDTNGAEAVDFVVRSGEVVDEEPVRVFGDGSENASIIQRSSLNIESVV